MCGDPGLRKAGEMFETVVFTWTCP